MISSRLKSDRSVNQMDSSIVRDPIDCLPDTFEEKEKLLEDILHQGIVKLLNHARKLDILEPPYGRPPQPTPLMTEEEFMKTGAWRDGSNVDIEPKFEYSYGFNALRYLAEYVKWAHPHSAYLRQREKLEAKKRLEDMGSHALQREKTRELLIQKLESLRSGILWGPFTSPISSKSAIVICQPLRPGQVFIEVSSDEDFNDIVFKNNSNHDPYECEDESNIDYPTEFLPFKMTIDELKPGQKYYVRVMSLFNSSTIESDSDNDTTRKFYCTCSFWTLPSEYLMTGDDSDDPLSPRLTIDIASTFKPVSIICIGLLPRSEQHNSSSNNVRKFKDHRNNDDQLFKDAINDTPTIACIIGDPLHSGNQHRTNHVYYNKSLFSEFYSQLIDSFPRLVHSSSFLMGWNDNRIGSDTDLKFEEEIFRQFRHDLKKYEKKHKKASKTFGSRLKLSELPPPPILQRPPLSHGVQALSEGFPVSFSEDSTVNFYRSFPFGPHIELFVLDLRNGYLGKHQSKWLRRSLSKSPALWKIVISGSPFGVSMAVSDESVHPITLSSRFPSQNRAMVDHGTNHVDLQLPEDEVDDHGRSKTSLNYILSYLQSCTAKDIDDDKSSQGDESKFASTATMNYDKGALNTRSLRSAQSDDSNRENLLLDFDVSPTDEELQADLNDAANGIINIQSGIVLLTSGISAPYIATFDPNTFGRRYCCEINTGSAYNRKNEHPTATAKNNDIEPTFLYNANDNSPLEKSYWTTVSFQESGQLTVKIFSKPIAESTLGVENLEYETTLTNHLLRSLSGSSL